MSRRWIALCALLLACDRSQPSARMVTMSGLQVPERTADDGTPDSCELLAAAAPQRLLGAEVFPAQRVYGLCLFEARDSVTGGAEKSIALEIRKDPAGTPRDLDAFWDREGAGVGFAGGKREQIETLQSLGDRALWHPIDGGLRLFAYWKSDRILVLTVRGVPTELALPWARQLAQTAIQSDS
jgi:hypothetical protein